MFSDGGQKRRTTSSSSDDDADAGADGVDGSATKAARRSFQAPSQL